jgi:hypothetical protein
VPKRGVGQQGTVSRTDAHVLWSGDALSSSLWRVVSTLDTIEQSAAVCATESAVSQVWLPRCAVTGSCAVRLARPRDLWRYWRFGVRVRGFLLPFRVLVLRCLKNSHARDGAETGGSERRRRTSGGLSFQLSRLCRAVATRGTKRDGAIHDRPRARGRARSLFPGGPPGCFGCAARARRRPRRRRGAPRKIELKAITPGNVT